MSFRRRSRFWIPGLVAAVCLIVWWTSQGGESLVVYCSHDAEFSEPILKEFERRTGIPVVIRFDTEATKSLSLIQKIRAERNQPQCDVFWNNETLGTVDLAEAGMLEAYRGSGFDRIPGKYRDPQGRWVGFAARLRVLIYNTEKTDQQRASAVDLRKIQPGDFSKMVLAKPMFGTTLTHYSVLWHELGGDKLKEIRRKLLAGGMQEVAGNAKAKDLVAEGLCELGWTDTDDYFVAFDQKQPVGMVPVRVGSGSDRTICIPNSVGIIKGSPRQKSARQLVDYLLSEEVELTLAQSTSRQIPLGPVDVRKVPGQVRQLSKYAEQGMELQPLSVARRACLEWLQAEHLQ